ncbi:MAG TPA: transcription termination factor NusA [Pleomorphomonadaceae bacterium]|nr:transcription termination factor NusA [Pleomorphomonadaceae bacterium]
MRTWVGLRAHVLFFVRQGGASVNRDFIGALLQLNAEKGVPQDILLQTLEQAIESAYRRNAEAPENVVVKIDPETGEISVYREYEVVAGDTEVTDPELQKTVSEAVEIEPGVGVGGRVRIPENVTQAQLGRIAAQTAGQVYRQRLREAERDVVYHQYVSREGEILTGVVTRTTESAVVLDMGRGVEAVLSVSEQLPGEHYRIGQHLKVFVLEVRRTTRGPVLVVSRTHRGFLRRLMEMEIPEIYNGSVVIRGIAREAGSRSKVAVESRQPGVDAKGAAVGQRGTRIQAIVAELNGEKVDVVLWNEDPSQFVAEALSPAEVIEVRIDEEHRIANVIVPERQLSLAIGREGQNARLAAKLTGWRIDIRSDAGVAAAGAGGTRVAPSSADSADGAERADGTEAHEDAQAPA